MKANCSLAKRPVTMETDYSLRWQTFISHVYSDQKLRKNLIHKAQTPWQKVRACNLAASQIPNEM